MPPVPIKLEPGKYPADMSIAWELADAADAITTSRFLANDLQVDTKPDLSPVTESDRAAELLLRKILRAQRHGDVVAGEEFGGMTAGDAPRGRVWLIDPIDGTKNYVRGVPVWATLIGLLDDGEPVVGMVSAPALGRRWWAQAGGGAWTISSVTSFLGRPSAAGSTPGVPRKLQVSNVADLSDASFSYSDHVGWAERRAARGFDELLATAWRTRAYGDFYSHVLVAEGAVDVAAEPDLNAWDVAAIAPIVREAGGQMTGFDNSYVVTAGCAVTTNGLLHARVLETLRQPE